MALYRNNVQSAGNPLVGATIEVHDEDSAVLDGNESTLALSTLYADALLTTTKPNPVTANSFGEFEFYMTSGSQVALKVSKPGYGTRWVRYVDVLGLDPL